jgi:sporulation protein YlmC with PRC-barrel domain
MLVSHRHLIGLSVVTKSGKFLGHIAELEIEAGSQQIYSYSVRARRLFGLGAKFLVGRAQVVSIDRAHMIVDDAVVAVTSGVQRKQGVASQIVPTNS